MSNERLSFEEKGWYNLTQSEREQVRQRLINDKRKAGATEDEIQEEMLKVVDYLWDDVLPLGCKACGECCSNGLHSRLSPYDAFRIAKYFNKETGDIVNDYCEPFHIEGSLRTTCNIELIPDTNSCPFLVDKKCSIHEVKPSVCRAFPLTKMVHGDDLPSSFYITVSCAQDSDVREQTIREWMGAADSEEGEEADIALTRLNWYLHTSKTESLHPRIAANLADVIFALLYSNYNTNDDFLPQFINRVNSAHNVLDAYGLMEVDDFANECE